GTNLTRDEAATRASLLDVTSYTIDLDLTTGDTHFGSVTTLEFTCREPGASTFADLVDATVHEITLNGRSLDPATAYADSRIALDDLEATNTLVVRADCRYTNTGEGLHRFVDPADDRVYLYSQFEVPDARRVFTTFEQPDLKSVFTFNVTAPAHWAVVSNSPTPEPEDLGEGRAVWHFPTTKRMSTYITAVVAGEYHAEFDTYTGKHGDIPLGFYCRQSLAEHMDTDNLALTTKQSFEFFEEQFDYPYPFGKYDQLFVPEYNMGAMENAGCVTFRDEYLPRSRQTRSFFEFRTSVITHEMAHMWFGNLVTMRWWDDLWLNESFAEWACYWCEAEATEFTDAWTGFANARKLTGYRADQLPSTHPIAADNHDLHAVEVNFDMITYAKGASVLKQLVAWVGLEDFLAGLRQYFKDFAYGNPEFKDLLAALEKASGRELQGWAKEWLQTAGVNTLSPAFELDDEGRYTSFSVEQTAPAEHPTLRRHRLGIGLYDEVDGRLVRRDYVEIDVAGASTAVAELVGMQQPALLLLNDNDHAFAKIRLDERSLDTAINGLSKLDDSLARALVWGAAWDMVRSAELPASAWVDLVVANIGQETDAWAVTYVADATRPRPSTQWAVDRLSDPAGRDALRARWEQGVRGLLLEAAPGSDHQLTFVRAYASAAVSDEAVAEVAGLLDGSFTVDGLDVDQDLRWMLIAALAAKGRVGDAEIDAELERDKTISGKEQAAAARASQPTAAAKDAAWAALMDPETPNETSSQITLNVFRATDPELAGQYVETFLDAAEKALDALGFHKASEVLEFGFPYPAASPEVLVRLDDWLATTTAPTVGKRFVAEARDELAMALAAQERDTRG
ncbi:MAG: aminopeptidase N, partial [Nocardioides sp.]|nr:aminopeptidase N [Nocardioides sp.]